MGGQKFSGLGGFLGFKKKFWGGGFPLNENKLTLKWWEKNVFYKDFFFPENIFLKKKKGEKKKKKRKLSGGFFFGKTSLKERKEKLQKK